MPTFSKSLIISILAVIAIFCAFNLALAQETGLKKPALQINIPTVSFGAEKGLWIGEYIRGIYQYAIGIVGILAAIVLMWGGVMWLTSGGNTGQVSEAKEWIKASLTGLVIALSSYTILYIINPDLTTFKSLNIESIKNIQSSSTNYNSLTRSGATIDLSGITDAASLTKAYEGLSLTPYLDSKGNWTIGYGHKLDSQEQLGQAITKEKAETLFLMDYQTAQNELNETMENNGIPSGYESLSSARRAVLVDMTFNMGQAGVNGFKKMWTAIANNNWATAAAEIKDSKYAGQVGKRADINAQIMESGKLP